MCKSEDCCSVRDDSNPFIMLGDWFWGVRLFSCCNEHSVSCEGDLSSIMNKNADEYWKCEWRGTNDASRWFKANDHLQCDVAFNPIWLMRAWRTMGNPRDCVNYLCTLVLARCVSRNNCQINSNSCSATAKKMASLDRSNPCFSSKQNDGRTGSRYLASRKNLSLTYCSVSGSKAWPQDRWRQWRPKRPSVRGTWQLIFGPFVYCSDQRKPAAMSLIKAIWKYTHSHALVLASIIRLHRASSPKLCWVMDPKA
jgi:hypothetical protein